MVVEKAPELLKNAPKWYKGKFVRSKAFTKMKLNHNPAPEAQEVTTNTPKIKTSPIADIFDGKKYPSVEDSENVLEFFEALKKSENLNIIEKACLEIYYGIENTRLAGEINNPEKEKAAIDVFNRMKHLISEYNKHKMS